MEKSHNIPIGGSGRRLGDLPKVMGSIGGGGQVKYPTIDTNVSPKLPFPGATIESNIEMGKISFDPTKFELYLDEGQQDGKYIEGYDLRKKLAKKNVVNAAFMDYLEAHPNLVPDSWKKNADGNTNYIYAWGTIFRNSDGNLFVRYWCWDDGALQSDYGWLVSGWDGQNPALVVASTESLSTERLDSLNLELSAAIEKLKGAGYEVIKWM